MQRAVAAAAGRRGAAGGRAGPRTAPDADSPQLPGGARGAEAGAAGAGAGRADVRRGRRRRPTPTRCTQAVREAIAEAGGAAAAAGGAGWIEAVRDACADLARQGAGRRAGGRAAARRRRARPAVRRGHAGPAAAGRGQPPDRASSSRRCSGSTRSTNQDEYLALAGELLLAGAARPRPARAGFGRLCDAVCSTVGSCLPQRLARTGRDERVLAWARPTTPATAVVVTTLGRVAARPAGPAGLARDPQGDLVGRQLTVIPPAGSAERRRVRRDGRRRADRGWTCADPDDVPDQVRDRVTRSVAYTAHHPLPAAACGWSAGGCRGVDGLTWHVRYDEGTDAADPEIVVAFTDALVAEASTPDPTPNPRPDRRAHDSSPPIMVLGPSAAILSVLKP